MTRSSGLVWRVVDALLGAPRLNELGERNLLVRMLADAWAGPVTIPEHPRAVEHLFSIVDACRGRPNGLTTLVDILEHIDPGASYLADLHRAVDPMDVLELWSDGERARLLGLLDGVTVANVPELYRAAAGHSAPKLHPRATWREAFALLETLTGGPDGVPRAIVFLELVAANLTRPELASQLKQWSERQAGLMGVVEELQAARRRPPLAGDRSTLPMRPAPRTPAYLIFLVQPQGVSGDMYRLSHWRQLNASGEWLPDRGVDIHGDLDVLRGAVAKLVESLEEEWAHYRPTIFVEFVLPEELLNLDVDQWAWDIDQQPPEPIGCHYPVVIRSLERMAKRTWHRPWYERWEHLQIQLSVNGAIALESGYWSSAGDGSSIHKIMSDFEKEPTLVVLMPSAPPLAKTVGAKEVVMGFRNGVPVMIWHRENCRSTEFIDAVTRLLHGDDPHNVLERVRQIRLNGFAAGSGAPHVGTRLSLLWDDPGRKVTPDHAEPPTWVAL